LSQNALTFEKLILSVAGNTFLVVSDIM